MGEISQMSGGILYLVLILAIFYFFIIRPQSKQRKDHQRMLEALKKGDDIVTIGGVHGKIMGFKNNDQIILIKVDDNTKLEIDRTAVAKMRGQEDGKK